MKLTTKEVKALLYNIKCSAFDYRLNANIEDGNKLIDKLRSLGYDAQILHSIVKEDEIYRYDYTGVYLQTTPFEIKIIKANGCGYNILAPFNELKNISYQGIRDIQNRFNSPNYIADLTVDNIRKWLEYYTEIYKLIKAENDFNYNSEIKFRQSIKNYPVRWLDVNECSGEITNNVFKFAFNISPTGISKKITLNGIENTLENFIKLTNIN